jgi:hypothetical protein
MTYRIRALARLRATLNLPAAARESFGHAAKLVHALAGSINNPALRELFLGIYPVREVLAGAAVR